MKGMRFKINSIGYGHHFVAVILCFGLAAPVLLSLLRLAWPLVVLQTLVYISLGIGGAALLFLVVLLAVEFWQDARIAARYPALRSALIALEGGKYECQACGHIHRAPPGHHCASCGIRFTATLAGRAAGKSGQ